MKKIDIKEIDKSYGYDFLDELRDGRSPDFNVMKVSAVLRTLVDSINELGMELEGIKQQLNKTQKSERMIKRKIKKFKKDEKNN